MDLGIKEKTHLTRERIRAALCRKWVRIKPEYSTEKPISETETETQREKEEEEEEEEEAIMAVVILDGTTVRSFVEDETEFKKSIDSRFAKLDLNNDGVLSRNELRKALETFRLVEADFGVDVVTPPQQLTELYDSIFEKFDCDKSGSVDPDEFRSEMKKIMLAIADGLGSSPIQMVLEDSDGNLLKKAADLEAAKIAQPLV